ncbi:MAG TPA: hypothetical protein EYN58_01750 [Candidatus Poseidoniales archaeon]|nr:hypothetical protein [Candidatus Poseidoniales archaeon]HIA24344.1 hypothetical protein [Candidatus Poseidoniales archaeon]HIB24231.1 hypothetical protein [Candidatus Poseidoniales archaeon]HIB40899.1 hypothetical protein [Candidatus Poseidoniales archaeon]HIN44764.1 hypothetical protein [Candidatus Poseidoniales archaeon]
MRKLWLLLTVYSKRQGTPDTKWVRLTRVRLRTHLAEYSAKLTNLQKYHFADFKKRLPNRSDNRLVTEIVVTRLTQAVEAEMQFATIPSGCCQSTSAW